jgi:HAD superfamily hydrolase (TIGR01549 family)
VTIRAVVFDVGETLVDESRAWGLRADRLGVSHAVFFATLGAVIERREHHRRVIDQVGPALEPEASQLLHYVQEDLYPDARTCLETLRADGYRVGIAGNQPAETTSFVRACGLQVDVVAMSDEWGVAKPDPRFFARVVEEMGLPAAEIAYVGDRIDNDVVPAAAAGLVAVFVRRGPWGYVQAGWPEAACAHLQVESLAELPAALRSLG